MAEIVVQQPDASLEASVVAQIDYYCTETDRLLAEMKAMQVNIDRLHSGTSVRMNEIEAALDRMAAK